MNPTNDHESYLKQVLHTTKMALNEKQVQHRIHCAIYETETTSMKKQIDSIERQLEKGANPK